MRATIDAGKAALMRRVANRAGSQLCPQEWPVFQPYVHEWIEHNPKGLGIIPLVIAAGAGAVAAGGSLWAYLQNRQYEAWKSTVPQPSKPPAPTAPQTAGQMQTWTPADLERTYAEVWQDWTKGAITYQPEQEKGSQDLVYAALGLAAVSLFLLTRD